MLTHIDFLVLTYVQHGILLRILYAQVFGNGKIIRVIAQNGISSPCKIWPAHSQNLKDSSGKRSRDLWWTISTEKIWTKYQVTCQKRVQKTWGQLGRMILMTVSLERSFWLVRGWGIPYTYLYRHNLHGRKMEGHVCVTCHGHSAASSSSKCNIDIWHFCSKI